MNKITFVLLTFVPFMEMAKAFLESRDENSTGADDNAAKALGVAIVAIKELAKS